MADDQIPPANERAYVEAKALRSSLDLMRAVDGDQTAVAIANAYVFEALNFIYRVTGASGANMALEMFRAELVKRHTVIDAPAASEVRQ